MGEEITEILIKCGIDKEALDCQDFVKARLMDSVTVAEVVIAIEDKYNIEIDGKDIIPKWFTSIERIECLVKKYLS